VSLPPVAAARSGVAEPLVPGGRFRDLRVLAQHANTYILCEARGALVLVDQHAAHERVNLVRLQADPSAALGPSQQLLTPVMVELPAGRARALSARVEALSAMGLDLRPMGGNIFAVQGVPGALARADLRTLVADLADEAAEEVHGMAVSGPVERALATMACHGSVKAGQELSHHEMRALLLALDEVDFGVCAHGRPVAIRLDSAELERRFHRT
jgi:DNA mismatch repair protein MutL